MKRRLLLIANDGGTQNYLPGVSHDITNYLSFFCSDEGGAWSSDEIRVLKNSDDIPLNSTRLHQFFLLENDVDYFLIVFTGHGYSVGADTYLELSPGNDCKVEDIRVWSYKTRCLLISDCCRMPLYGQGGRLPSVPNIIKESDQSDHRKSCLEIYNRCIMEVPMGTFTIGYAASLGESAGDTSKGGIYSATLFDEARKLISLAKTHPSTKDIVYSYSLVHTMAVDNMPKSQQPCIETQRGPQFPFVVIPHNTRSITEYTTRVTPLKKIVK